MRHIYAKDQKTQTITMGSLAAFMRQQVVTIIRTTFFLLTPPCNQWHGCDVLALQNNTVLAGAPPS